MMKNLLLVSVFLITALSISAQSEVGTLSVYPRMGLNSSNLTSYSIYTSMSADASCVNSKRKAGLVIGAEMEYQWLKGVGLTGGLLYSVQGYKFDDCETSQTPKEMMTGFNESMHYIIMPLMINLYVYKNLAIKTGVQLGYLLKSRCKYSYVTENSKQEFAGNSQIHHKWDFSIPVGVSYEYEKVVLDLRYNLGISNVNKYDVDASKNSVIMMTIGYKIKI